MTDRDGTTHSYEYDDDGNQIADVITKLGTGVDGTVMERDTDYNDEGQPVDYTTKNAAGEVLSQVEESYDGNGNVIAEAQSHDGAVSDDDTPTVSYGYQETAGGQERQSDIIYPDGREISYGYSSTPADAEGWIDTVSDANSFGDHTLESLSYAGDGTVMGESRPQTGANEAISLDNFGNIADLNWTNSSAASTDHYGYGYDADGNVMYKENYVDTADSELYHVNGASGGYDGLNRLTTFARGTLSTSTGGVMLDTISSPSTTQSWDLDALGNQTSVTTNGTAQSKTQNGQNQTTSVTTGGTTNDLTYDANGATTTDEDGRVWKYDAWGDPVAVTNSSGTLIETDAFDALGRRTTVTTYSGGSPTTADLYYSTAGQVIEKDQSGSVVSQTVYSVGYVNSVIEVDQATGSPGTLNQRLYVQQDANYNVTSVTDTSGTVLERYIYSPYGEQTVLNPDGTVKGDGTPASSSYNLPNGFQGMLFDPVLSDNLTAYRVYDPMLGTWTSEDPAGAAGSGDDLFQLENGAPTGALDPAGLKAEINDNVNFDNLKPDESDPDVVAAYRDEAYNRSAYYWNDINELKGTPANEQPEFGDGGQGQINFDYKQNQKWFNLYLDLQKRYDKLMVGNLKMKRWLLDPKHKNAIFGPMYPGNNVSDGKPPKGEDVFTVSRSKMRALGDGISAAISGHGGPGSPTDDDSVPLPDFVGPAIVQNEKAEARGAAVQPLSDAAKAILNELINGLGEMRVVVWEDPNQPGRCGIDVPELATRVPDATDRKNLATQLITLWTGVDVNNMP